MKDLEISSEWIDRFHDGELNEEELRLFRERLASNALLRAEVELNASLNRFLAEPDLLDLMKKIGQVRSKRPLTKKNMKLFLMAAVFLGVTLIAWLVYLVLPDIPGSPVSELPNEPRHAPGALRPWVIREESARRMEGIAGHYRRRPDDLSPLILTDPYLPLPAMEALAGVSMRSAGFRLLSPLPSIEVAAGTTVPFKWIYVIRPPELRLVIMNNLGMVIRGRPMDGSDHDTIHTALLPCGLYYWKILEGDDLVTAGKIKIEAR